MSEVGILITRVSCHKKFGPPFNCSPGSKYFEVLGPLATRFRVGLGLGGGVRVGN